MSNLAQVSKKRSQAIRLTFEHLYGPQFTPVVIIRFNPLYWISFLFLQWVGLRLWYKLKDTPEGITYNGIELVGFCWPLSGYYGQYRPQPPRVILEID